MKHWTMAAVALCIGSAAGAVPASWRQPPGNYHPVPSLRTIVDQLRPGYQQSLIGIATSTMSEREKQLARLRLREEYLDRIRRNRRQQYEAHYVRAETTRTCASEDIWDSSTSCKKDQCFSSPSGDYYTTPAWAGYYRGHNISNESIRRGVNGLYRSGRFVPIRKRGSEVCSVDVNGLQHGTVKIMTRANFRYRPAFVNAMTITDSDAILAGIS